MKLPIGLLIDVDPTRPPGTYGSRFLRGMGILFNTPPSREIISRLDAQIESGKEKQQEEQDDQQNFSALGLAVSIRKK